MKKITLLSLLTLTIISTALLTSCKKETPTPETKQGNIAGIVTDKETQKAIAGVKIAVTDTERSTTTSTDGKFEIKDLQTGTYTLSATMIGYEPTTVSVTVKEGETVTANIAMTPSTVLSVTTTPITAITDTEASSGGTLTPNGTAITEAGVCWSTKEAPTTADSKASATATGNSFIVKITGLLPNTKYFVRSYVQNAVGTVYGNELSFTTLTADQEITIPDANFRAYLIAEYDANDDGKILLSEINKIKSLNVSEKAIASLEGIEYFTALETLSCNLNDLTALTVSTLTNLTKLFCGGNKLTALEVNTLTKLEVLDCGENAITTLSVDNLTNLTKLDVEGNKLTSLDVHTLTNLLQLGCRTNMITSLDLSNLTKLEYLYCQENQLNTLSVSTLTKLKQLFCHKNQIEALDVSNLPDLKLLYCNNNEIALLNLGNLTGITEIRCSYNPLSALNVSKLSILADLSCINCPNLTTIYVSQAQKDTETNGEIPDWMKDDIATYTVAL